MRYFNTYGPVNEQEHYVVSRKALVTELATQVTAGKYFTIYAPRQMGKTTLLHRLAALLQQQPNFLPVALNFEAFEGWPVEDFLQGFGLDLSRALLKLLQIRQDQRIDAVQQLFAGGPPTSFLALRELLVRLHELLADQNLVLIIDEFDGTPQAAISQLLQMWRQIYLTSQPPRPLHSIVLVGLQNIATLNLGRSSPFNIAQQVQLAGFSLEEVQDLLGQHTAETGQAFAPGVIAEVYRQTNGHPFLVNRLAAILTETIATDRALPITQAHLETAIRQFTKEANYNFESLVRHANEQRADVLNILFGAKYQFSLNTPAIRTLHMHGIISPDEAGLCEIANPIYAEVLLAAFRPVESGLQGAILVNGYDFRPHLAGGQLQMSTLLTRFREFIERRGQEAFKVTPMPQEATGQYLLMAYLELLVRQVGGDLFTEVDSGDGRLDLLVTHQGQRHIIETKIWRGPSEFEKGLAQLENYLAREGQSVGYYVVFHARPRVYGKLAYEQLEFVEQRAQATIHVYLVRLGAVLGETENDAESDELDF